MQDIVVVTRHPALVTLLVEKGIISRGCAACAAGNCLDYYGPDAPYHEDGPTVLEHVLEHEVRGKHVIGVLPLRLAALAASVTELPLLLSSEDRGKELGIDRLREVAGDPVTYKVTILR
jgi:hypothetical protein